MIGKNLEIENRDQLDGVCCDSNCDTVTDDMCRNAVTTIDAISDEEGASGIQENLYQGKNNDQKNGPQGVNRFETTLPP